MAGELGAPSMTDLGTNTQADAANPQVTTSNAPQTTPTGEPTEAQHNTVGHMFHDVLDALGGKEDVSYSRDANGKLVTSKTPRKPGEQWASIVAGALTGLAASSKLPSGERRNPAAAAATGAAASGVVANQRDKQARERADEDADQNRKALEFKANMVKLNQEITHNSFVLAEGKYNFGKELANDHKAFMDQITNGDPENKYLGVAHNPDEIRQLAQQGNDLIHAHGNGQIVSIPHVDDKGQVDGTEYAFVTPEWQQRMITERTTVMLHEVDKNGNLVEKPVTVAPGTYRNSDIQAWKQADSKMVSEYGLHKMEIDERGKEARLQREQVREQHNSDRQDTRDFQLAQAGRSVLQKSADDYQKFLGSANTIKQSVASAKDGNELAAAVEPLQGTLFIMAEGGVKRINRQELEGVKGAGSLVQNIEGYLGKLGKGDPIPDKLKDDMVQLVNLYQGAKYDAYKRESNYTMKLHNMDPRATPILGADGQMLEAGPSAVTTTGAPGAGGWGAKHGGVARQQQPQP